MNYQPATVPSEFIIFILPFQRMLEFDPAARVTAADALNSEYFAGEETVSGIGVTRLDMDRIGGL